MIDLATLVLGPLVVPECRRSVGRGWIILVRALSALATSFVTLVVLLWWTSGAADDPFYMPFTELRVGLLALEGIALATGLVLSPGVLAGSLAGERERGSLGLLLTTQVTPREIVLGRLAGKFSQVVMILLAGLPHLILIGALAGLSPIVMAVALGLPAAVAFGAGGIAAGASAVARRGRNALMGVYLVIVLFLLSPLLESILGGVGGAHGIAALNPFLGLWELTQFDDVGTAVTSLEIWVGMGVAGAVWASWRLRPACLRFLGFEGRGRRGGRRFRVPSVGERPVLWKEWYIERVGALGWFGQGLGILLVLFLFGGGTALTGLILWSSRYEPTSVDNGIELMHAWVGGSSSWFACLIQWAIGLRAAVAIASERERGTWEGLLTSPLEGKEIVRGKLWGSLHALRWLGLAALWTWTWALILGAMPYDQYYYVVCSTILIGAFMAAVGVRASLASSTATRAMSITMGVWLFAYGALAASAAMLIFCGIAALMFCWLIAVSMGLAAPESSPWLPPIPFGLAWTTCMLVLYVIATAIIAGESALRFDRTAGRMAGSGVAIAVDRMIHGGPMEPVPLGSADR